MTRASAECSSPGSEAECAEGSRCWPLEEFDLQVCYPDCETYDCIGACDGQGSCIPTGDMDCDRDCGSACTDTICVPSCEGRECGGDGCGGSCGACGAHQSCDEEAGRCRCEHGYLEYTTSEGRTFCCSADRPRFCEPEGRGPSCWPEITDCDSIMECGGEWMACAEGRTAYCSSFDTFHCCSESHPRLCEAEGYGAGCWAETVDCSTITFCGDDWHACEEGSDPACTDGTFTCSDSGD